MRYNDFKISDPVDELAKRLVRIGRGPLDVNVIRQLVNKIAARHNISSDILQNDFIHKHGNSPDNWIKQIKQRNEEVNEGDVIPLKRKPEQVQYGTRTFPPKQPNVTEPRDNIRPIRKKNTTTSPTLHSIYEEEDPTINEINKFIEWTKEVLHIKRNPKFTFSKDTEKAQEGHHTGVHSGNDIWVYIGNRNLIDILRTVFHELVHQRQEELNMIEPGDSYPGSPIEAMADMLAGKYIKIYGKEHPEIFQ